MTIESENEPKRGPKPEIFQAHIRKMRDGQVDPDRIMAVVAAHESLEAAIAVGRSLVPNHLFTFQDAVKLAELIYHIESDIVSGNMDDPLSDPATT